MTAQSRNPKGWRSLVAAAVCLALSGLWLGCTPEKRYRVLSFFFDGVPNPNPPAKVAGKGGASQGSDGQTPAAQAAFYTHKPYAQQQCQECHVSKDKGQIYVSFDPVDSRACLKCHQKVTQEYPVMHGPVAADACLWCHDPHQADNAALLKAPSPELCLQCHDRQTLGSRPPEHQLAKASCLDCHFGHGAQQHKLLRPTRPTTAPVAVSFAGQRGGRP